MDLYVTLRLFFFGLVVFVPDHPDTGRMTVLLLEARNPPHATDGCPIHAHTPMLYYQASQCPTGCTPAYGLCGCELKREQICLRGELQPREKVGATPMCKGVARMKKIRENCGKLRQDCLAGEDLCTAGGSTQQVCGLIAARLDFRRNGLEMPCNDLGEIPFAPLTHTWNWWPPKLTSKVQSLADVFLMETKLVVPAATSVEIDLVNFGRAGSRKLTLPPPSTIYACGTAGQPCRYDLVIANVPAPHAPGHSYGRCSTTGMGLARDFELYHDLAHQPLPLYQRPVPKLLEELPAEAFKPVAECQSGVLEVFLQSILRTGLTRDICPPSSMSN